MNWLAGLALSSRCPRAAAGALGATKAFHLDIRIGMECEFDHRRNGVPGSTHLRQLRGLEMLCGAQGGA